MENGGIIRTVDNWCKGRCWIGRALLLCWFAYIGLRHLLNSQYTSLFKAINLGIHEGGHLLFGIFGIKFLTIAGGTMLQLMAPIAAVIIFLRQRDYFAICFAAVWMATNFYDVAVYVADARALALPLVTVGNASGPVTHDWNYMLFHLGLINQDTMIAGALRAGGFVLLWGAVAAGLWMCCRMVYHECAERRAAAEDAATVSPTSQFLGATQIKPPISHSSVGENRPPLR
ncbi:MAG: hypothetical protein ACYSTL_02950 [Planctomycetota bacterium]|jgi:hypothetical protein